MARVVVVEPFYGGSHRFWLDGWRSHSEHDLELITLPDKFWRWRMRGGAVALAQALVDHVNTHGRPDLVVVSALTDVASLAGLARRALGETALAIYMHENQLLYPLAPNQQHDESMALTNWRSLMAADAVWWNSAFHRDALMAELPVLLGRQPDQTIDPTPEIVARSSVLWPGVDARLLIGSDRQSHSHEPPLVLWNQRWDHDKNPRAVFSALRRLAGDGVEFRLALAGEDQGRHGLADVLNDLEPQIVHRGWLDRAGYVDLLLRSDVVVSAADHEFFGIAIVEAIAAGATPVLPNRLSFPELIADKWHSATLYGDGNLSTRLADVLSNVEHYRAATDGLRDSMQRFDVAATAGHHDQAVNAAIASGREQ